MPIAPFLHLRVQSAYSLLEGALHPADIASLCVQHHQPAVAVVDRNNLFGAMEFTDACLSTGVQPIIGAMVAIARPGSARSGTAGPLLDELVLLAQTPVGYDNLVHLVSHAHLGVEAAESPHLLLADLAAFADGLLCLTGGIEGGLYRLLAEGQALAAEDYLAHLKSIFSDRLYIELQRVNDPSEGQVEPHLIALADRYQLPLVATNPVLFAAPVDHAAHDILTCIQQSTVEADPHRRKLNPDFYFKSPEAMAKLFADVPEAIANTHVIAQRCAVKAPSRQPILPKFAADGEEPTLLGELALAGLNERLDRAQIIAPSARQAYIERLNYELDVIIQMGFPGYFLIVADFIQWAKEQGIPVGPGRGSGAGSVVAWALKITDLDPLRHGLLFERFLNPERVSMPDFDIDFCETRRGEVIRYVQEKYGADHVAQIITFGKLKARAVIKDVGRAMHLPYGMVDGLSKLIPNNPAAPVSLREALGQVTDLKQRYRSDPEVARLIDAALQLEGLYRHASTHAAGVVIGDRPLDKLVPLYRDPRSDMAVTQFDMKWVEKAGLIKFDFLGLKTLSVLQRAVDLLSARTIHLDLLNLPWDDAGSYALMARGDTVGVFQMESEGMRRTLSLVKPDKFADIVALVALYRPGPMDNIPQYAARKHGREQPDYLDPLLEPVLRETYGVIIYQEQVMQIAQILAGYSLGEADLLRRAMGKKKKEEMDAQKERFISGAMQRGITARKADHIFELVAKFAGYGFNKSHAAGYALVAYQTAYLKANYPVEFFAASMAYDITNTDKLAVYVEDINRSGVPLLPPDINRSGADFTIEALGSGHAVRYALAALKGVGEKAMEAVVAEREAHGSYRSLGDLANRLDPKNINKRQLESLASGGALDPLVKTRAAAHQMVDQVLAHAAAAAHARASAQVSLFGEHEQGGSNVELLVPTIEPWNATQMLAMEKEAVGFYLSAHPLDAFAHILKQQNVLSGAEALALESPFEGKRAVVLAGLPEDVRVRPGQRGQFALLSLADRSGTYQIGCFDDALVERCRALVQAGAPIIVRAELVWRPGEEVPRINGRELTPLAEFAANCPTALEILITDRAALSPLAQLLAKQGKGRGQVRLKLLVEDDIAELVLPPHQIDAELRSAIAGLPGVSAVSMHQG